MEVKQEFFTVREVATILGLSVATVYLMTRDGRLQALKFGNSLRIPRAAVDSMVKRAKRGEVGGREPTQAELKPSQGRTASNPGKVR